MNNDYLAGNQVLESETFRESAERIRSEASTITGTALSEMHLFGFTEPNAMIIAVVDLDLEPDGAALNLYDRLQGTAYDTWKEFGVPVCLHIYFRGDEHLRILKHGSLNESTLVEAA